MYDVGGNRFLLGDCFERMAEIATGSVDMVLADLPYGTTQNRWDAVLPFEPLWREYWRVCRPGAAVVLTAAQPFTSALVMSAPREFRYACVWLKNVASNFMMANKRPMPKHEDVLVFCQAAPPFYPQRSPGSAYVAKRHGNNDTGENYRAIEARLTTDNSGGGRSPTSQLHFPREVGMHPTQKPVALFEYLIRTYTEPGALVLDNTAGSGTTAIAALNAGRRFVCIERDPGYYWSAVARVCDWTPPATQGATPA